MDTADKAVEIWDSMNPSERHGVSLGMFPVEKMQSAIAAGYQRRTLELTLMQIATANFRRTEGGMLAQKYVSRN